MSKSKVRKPEANSSPEKEKRSAAISIQTSEAAAKKSGDVIQTGLSAEISEIIKELVRLAQEQGHLTYNDINDVLPESTVTPEKLDEVFSKLRSLEIEIVDQ